MGESLPPRTWRSGPFFPSTPRTGNEGDNVSWRKSNLITRGRDGRFFEETFSGLGELDVGSVVEMVEMTGTITLTEDSNEILGVGTLFNSECPFLGQRIVVIPEDNSYSFLLVVQQIIDDEHMVVWRSPSGVPWPSVSGLIGWLMPRLYQIENMRGQSTWGNVLKLDRGSYLGVGLGEFLLNGAPLAGTSMVLSRRPSIALYDPLTFTYGPVVDLGMDTPVPPTLAAVGGGVKMQGGSYSWVLTPARKETVGYNNPSDRVDVTIATNDMIACTFPPMDVANGQNAWIIWVTTFADTLGADLNYLNGPWHRFRLVDDTEVNPAGGDTLNFEYYDAEVENNEIVSFNNDPPTDAAFVEQLNNAPVWISCQGQGWNLHPEATSPGPFIVPAKVNNIEAAPLDIAFSSSPPETIVGGVMAQGRVYLLTVNKLQIAQSTPSDVVPILIRPYWHSGFANPEQVVFVNGMLYGFPVAGPSRSAADGDESYIEHNWAADVYEFTKDWNPGQVLVGMDPFNDAVVFFHIADRLNAAGYWTTKWLMYGIPQQFWIGAGEFTDDEKDQIVCGVATIADRLELLISGREGPAIEV